MQMKPEEIARLYRTSANKRLQIGILAELNLCTKEEIIEILKNQGISDGDISKTRKKRTKGTETVEGDGVKKVSGKQKKDAAVKEDKGKEQAEEINKDVQMEKAGDAAVGEKLQEDGLDVEDKPAGIFLMEMKVPERPEGNVMDKLPQHFVSCLNSQRIILTERIEQDTKKVRAINELLKAYAING